MNKTIFNEFIIVKENYINELIGEMCMRGEKNTFKLYIKIKLYEC